MADLTLRTVKGSELTFQEIDTNFTSLDSDIQVLKSNSSNSGSAITSTTDLPEGTNLYYTDDRADIRATLRINDATTDNIDEGSTNLYYTQARFDSDVTSNIDSDYIQSRQAFSAFDSDEVTSIIDSDYIEAHLDGIDASDGGNDF